MDGEPVFMATSERDEVLGGKVRHVQKINEGLFKNLNLVFFAGKEGSKGAGMQWGDTAVRNGCVVIDNGGDFRMYPNIPLVIPEVNMHKVKKDSRYICNPNCSTIQLVVALYPLHRASGLRRVVVSSYQSVSGHSGAGIEQLREQTEQMVRGEILSYDAHVFSKLIASDCLPHIDSFTENGYTREEIKLINETRKIMDEPNLLISPTTVRVPVYVGHSEAINAEFIRPMDREKAIEILSDKSKAPGVVLIDGKTSDPDAVDKRNDINELRYPSTRDLLKKELRDMVLVGRIRDDTTAPNAINFWCVSDNLRKGAATNAVQIAEEMLKLGYI